MAISKRARREHRVVGGERQSDPSRAVSTNHSAAGAWISSARTENPENCTRIINLVVAQFAEVLFCVDRVLARKFRLREGDQQLKLDCRAYERLLRTI